MLKVMGILLIIGSFAGIGIAQHQNYRERVNVLQGLLHALELIADEVSFRLTSVPNLVELLSHNKQPQVAELFSKMNTSLQEENGLSLTYKWMKTFQQYGEENGLKEEDIRILCDMSDFIGKYDAKSQKKSLEYAHKRLETQLEMARADLKNKGMVYRTCCIAAGMLLVFVLL
jgi:stage III sporulation protein AB